VDLVTTSARRTLTGEQGRRGRAGDNPGRADRPERLRKLLAAGASAACTATGIGLAVVTMLVLAGWIAAPHLGLGLIGVLRTAAVLWLVGHHVTVQVSGAGQIGMLPLGLVALPGALLWRAGRAVVRGHQVTGLREATAVALAVAIPYAALSCALAVASRSGLAAASIPQALLASFVIAFVAAGFGAARALAPWAHLGALISARTRSVLAGTAAALAVLIAAGAMATALALAGDVQRFNDVYRLLDPGVVGAGLLLLAQFAYLPNAVIWAVAYMLGPGFAVGAGTVAAPTGSVLGPMPAFPLLAALPAGAHGGGPGWLGALMLAFPYLAGAVAGALVVRTAPTTVLESAPMRGLCCGLLTGLALGVGASFAGGPLGDGRMAVVGPSPWQVAAVASLEVGIAAAITAGLVNWWYVRKRWDAQAGPTGRPLAAHPAGRPPDQPGQRAGKPARWPPGRLASTAGDDGHVIYMDRWAEDDRGGDVDGSQPRRRPGGPSAIPRQ
jgi:hypothetical protein